MPALHSLVVSLSETGRGLPRRFWWLWTATLVNKLGGFVVPFVTLR